MKKLFILLIFAVLTSVSTFAKDRLEVMKFFDIINVEKENANTLSIQDTEMNGNQIKLYKSISVSDNDLLCNRISNAVLSDSNKAVSKEVAYKDGHLYFGFYFMGGSGANRKYLLFLDRRQVKKNKLSLIYIEGNLDSSDVKKMIKK